MDRELEAVALVMEAFEDFEDKIQYDILGHSGDSPSITFVSRDKPPKNNKERLDVIRVSELVYVIDFSYIIMIYFLF